MSTTIRGIRINLAAAICWESYMPLLRQALYAQNINLYLAPTADGRDGWASLMRTVGTEGRCFVLTSNMAVRGGGQQAQSSEIAVQDGEEPEETVRFAQNALFGRRRNSCLTEDGNEIALPAAANTTAARRPRRASCLTEEGNEIALPSSPAPVSPGTTRTSSSKRRKSVIVEDGNEIVLCCDDDTPTNGAPKVSAPTKQRAAVNGTKSQEWISRGGSMIVNPFGDVLAGPQWEDEEGIIFTDVDFEDCVRGRLDLDAAGSYSRYGL